MGDVVDFGEGGDQQEPTPAKRKMNFPILKILLFVGIGVLVLGVMITVAFVVSGIKDKNGTPQSSVPMGEDYQDVLPAYVYSSQLPEMRLSTADKPAATVIVKVLIGYEKNNKGLENELTERQPQIRDFLRNFFSLKKADELQPAKERKLKDDIRTDLNDMMASKGVRDILFEKLQTVEQ
jgi:flagellar basal body-associated protein FliL